MANNRIALDLKQFKHVKSDDKSTTLEHKDGHILTIAHEALSPKFKEQLAALSKIPEETETNKKDARVIEDSSKKPVQKFADGGFSQLPVEIAPGAMSEPSQLPQDPTAPTRIGTIDPQLELLEKDRETNPLGNVGDSPFAQPANDQTAVANAQPVPSPQTAQGGQSPDLGATDIEGQMRTGVNQELSGLQKEAEAKGQLGSEQADIAHQQAESLKQATDAYQSQFNDLDHERQAHMSDILNGHIDPQQYWKGDPQTGEGGHSKIATAIGMIIAGFNPTTQPNAAVNFLKYQMDQNLRAQERNLGSKETLLNANLHQFGNIRDATDMTRIMQHDMVANQLMEASGKAASPLAKAAALKSAGQIRLETVPMLQNFALRRAMMNLSDNGGSPDSVNHVLSYMRVVAPEQAKEMETRYVPGVGLGSVPVPDSARQSLIGYKNAQDLMQRSLDFSAQHRGLMDKLSLSEQAQAKTIQQQLIGTIKQAQHDGVYKESEANFLLNQIGGSPLSFVSKLSSEPKLRELMKIKQNEFSNLAKTYGIKGAGLSAPGVGASDNAPIAGANGKQYVRQMINGKAYMVPVSGGK